MDYVFPSPGLVLQNEAQTLAFAKVLQQTLPERALIGFHGPLGAGKTHLIRDFLHLLSPGIRVPSPTFVLEQIYEFPGVGVRWETVSHWDFYRLPANGPLPPEFLESSQEHSLVLVEWPERCPEILENLDLELFLDYHQQLTPDSRLLQARTRHSELRLGLRNAVKSFS